MAAATAKSFVAACLQMSSGGNLARNLARADALLRRASAAGAKLAALPEFFPLLAADEKAKLAIAEKDGAGKIQDFLSAAARRHNLYLVGGTTPIAAGGGKVYSACLLFAPNGRRLARYDKMHLFRYRGATEAYNEAATICPGNKVVAVNTPLGRIGLSVCYDLRFPELYRQMQKPDIVVAPSAFVPETGRAHWQLLLRARAVENLAHVIGAAQAGIHAGGRKTYGHSMIVGPWGETLAHATNRGEACLLANIDATARAACRARLPALNNRRL